MDLTCTFILHLNQNIIFNVSAMLKPYESSDYPANLVGVIAINDLTLAIRRLDFFDCLILNKNTKKEPIVWAPLKELIVKNSLVSTSAACTHFFCLWC